MNNLAPIDHAAIVNATIDQQRQVFNQEGEVSAEVRISRINRAIDLLFDNREAIVDAVSKDFGNRSRHQSLMSDVYACLEALKLNRDNLQRWMKKEKRALGLPFNLFGARAEIRYQPKGVIGILGTWNFPVNTVFCPLAGVLAAGNRAVLKFSEVTPAIAELMDTLVPTYFEPEEVACVNGGPELGAAFSAAKFDHLVFTGAGSIGQLVMQAASANLTPLTLELGGKSPVIIDEHFPVQEAAERIMSGKALNAGQVCLSPDYVFVPEHQLQTFVDKAEAWFSQMFPSLLENPDFTSVVNARHCDRLQGYVDEAKAAGTDVRCVNPANEDFSEQQHANKLPLHIVINPSDDLAIMQQEIFGPLIVVKSYRTVDECINYINVRDRPLGLYIFSHDQAFQENILTRTISGGVTINDVIMHGGCDALPFGGIGPSGMGSYHGVDGFKAFSHARSVYKQSRINLQKLGGMLPPYGKKCEKTLTSMIKK